MSLSSEHKFRELGMQSVVEGLGYIVRKKPQRSAQFQHTLGLYSRRNNK